MTIKHRLGIIALDTTDAVRYAAERGVELNADGKPVDDELSVTIVTLRKPDALRGKRVDELIVSPRLVEHPRRAELYDASHPALKPAVAQPSPAEVEQRRIEQLRMRPLDVTLASGRELRVEVNELGAVTFDGVLNSREADELREALTEQLGTGEGSEATA